MIEHNQIQETSQTYMNSHSAILHLVNIHKKSNKANIAHSIVDVELTVA